MGEDPASVIDGGAAGRGVGEVHLISGQSHASQPEHAVAQTQAPVLVDWANQDGVDLAEHGDAVAIAGRVAQHEGRRRIREVCDDLAGGHVVIEQASLARELQAPVAAERPRQSPAELKP